MIKTEHCRNGHLAGNFTEKLTEQLISGYLADIRRLCDELDKESLKSAIEMIRQAHMDGKQIFIAGNGGSAATANHFSCDFSKNAVSDESIKPKLITLSSNIEYITAIANDMSYEGIFAEQLKNLMHDGDLLILISASGNSPNIIKAAEYAKSRKGRIIGFTGFSGGKLEGLSDICVNIAVDSYEKVEDMHLVLTHIIVCCFKSACGGSS